MSFPFLRLSPLLSPAPSLFPECLALKRIIYQIIFIQVRRRKAKRRGGGGAGKAPFAVLIAWRCTCEKGAGLIKGSAAEALPLANESCHVTGPASPMDQIAPQTIQ